MTANIPVRAAAGEDTGGTDLINLRSNHQAVKFGLAIHHPITVFTARVNQIFTTTDSIVEIEYDGAVGIRTDVLSGMTMYIGSVAGARDKGVVRIRRTPTAAKIHIGAASISIANNDYLTVVRDFSLWGREAITQGGVVKMDSEITFANRTGSAVIRAAPIVAVIKRVAGVATFTPPSPALSACYDGATISSWLYTAPGAATTSNMTSGTGLASWTYTTAGQYLWSLTVTDSNGRVTVTRRWVYVDNASPDFALSEDPQGDFSNGFWSFGVTMYDNATISDIADRALVTLYAEHEYYDGVEKNISKLAGYENIVCTGWIDGESITRDAEQGTVTFSVKGAAFWLGKIRAAAFGLESISAAPTKWTQLQNMTPKKALAQILVWTSTATLVMDCFFPNDATPISVLAQPSGSLLSQLNAAADNTIFANVAGNNLGQLFIEVDPQMMNSAQRTALVTVQAITTEDYEDTLEIERLTSASVAMVELECDMYDGNKVKPVYSRAPGNTGLMFGEYNAPSNFAAVDQAECNRLAGCLLAISNPTYDTFDVTLGQNRLIDIAPAQYCQISVATGDTPRGITLTNRKIIPRSVSYKIKDGYYKTAVNFELASLPTDGVSYFPPKPAEQNVEPYESGGGGYGEFPSPIVPFPNVLPGPIVTPADCKTSTDIVNAPSNQSSLTWDKQQLLGADATEEERTANAWCSCSIRKSGCVYPTSVYIMGYFQGISESNIHVYGIKDGTRVITATLGVGISGINATFDTATALVVDGFQIVLDAGSGYVAGDQIATGTVAANSEAGVLITSGLTVGALYAVEGAGGGWNWYHGQNMNNYLFSVSDENGRVGQDGRSYIAPTGYESFALRTPSTCLFSEQLTTLYGRTYFQYNGVDLYFECPDINPQYDNEGTLDYILREATGAPLIANINGSNVNNVCSA